MRMARSACSRVSLADIRIGEHNKAKRCETIHHDADIPMNFKLFRVKNVDFLITKRPAPHPPLPIIVTVSSDGKMNVHDVTSVFRTDSVEDEIIPMATYDTSGSRLVCCRVAAVTRTTKQIKQEMADVKVGSVVKKEDAESANQLRFKDGGDDSGDEVGEADGMDEDEEEEEQEQEDEEEQELEDEAEEE